MFEHLNLIERLVIGAGIGAFFSTAYAILRMGKLLADIKLSTEAQLRSTDTLIKQVNGNLEGMHKTLTIIEHYLEPRDDHG